LVITMRLARYFLGAFLVTGACGIAVSCGDDNTSTNPTTSTGGKAGGGGKAGAAGSSTMNAGGGGMGGSGGTGGSAGGQAGSGGRGGSGGGGAGGVGGGGAGGGGTAGAGGGGTAGMGGAKDGGAGTAGGPADGGPDSSPDVSMGTDGGGDAQDASANDAPDSTTGDGAAAAAKVCYRTCNSTNDCPSVLLQDYICNAAHHCVVCSQDITCVAQSSGWATDTCTTDADCTAGGPLALGDYCVDVEGIGRCAYDKNKIGDAGGIRCLGNNDVVTVKKFGGDGAVVEVCAETSQKCDAQRGECFGGCNGNGECSAPLGGKICNMTTHRCECGSSTDCGGSTPTCNTAIKKCECGSVASCPATDGAVTYVCE
jgi:hypothetical protein